SAPLPIVGPSGSNVAPDFATFLNRMFDARSGAFQVLGQVQGAEQPNSARPVLNISVVDVAKWEPTKVLDRYGLIVTAQGIPHSMPTLAYPMFDNFPHKPLISLARAWRFVTT